MASPAAPMNRFGFIIHPIDPKVDVARKFPILGRYLSERMIHFLSTFFPPIYLSHVTGLRSYYTEDEIEGWFVACPYTPVRMTQLPTRTVYRKIIQTARLAERLGAQIIGLGAFTSVVGDAGLTISRSVDTPVTTGDSYTVAVAVETLLMAGERMGVPIEAATVAIVGATGAIGSAAAELLAESVRRLILVGRDVVRLEALRQRLESLPAEATISTDMASLSGAELVLSASSSPHPVIGPEHLAPGAVVCDIARPHDVSRRVRTMRPDVLVIDGGLVEVPGEVNYGFDFGFPLRTTYACMAETMALAMEGRFESFTLGKRLQVARVKEIRSIAARHGFRVAGYRSFDSALTEGDLARIRTRAEAARRARRGSS